MENPEQGCRVAGLQGLGLRFGNLAAKPHQGMHAVQPALAIPPHCTASHGPAFQTRLRIMSFTRTLLRTKERRMSATAWATTLRRAGG